MRPVFLFVAVVLLIAGPAQANNTPRNFLFDAKYLEMLRFAYETYRGNGVDSATVDTNGTAGNQLTFDDPANSNYKWAQVALWALVETEDNRKKNPHWYKSIDVQWAIDYYKRSATNWDSGPNLKLPLGQKLVGADEVAGLQNLAKTISDDLADIRGIQSLRKTSRFRAKRR